METNTVLSSSIQKTKTTESKIKSAADFSPYLKFTYGLNAPESKRQYPKRFQVFLDYLQVEGKTVEEKSNKLYYDYILIKGKDWLETELLKFFILFSISLE